MTDFQTKPFSLLKENVEGSKFFNIGESSHTFLLM